MTSTRRKKQAVRDHEVMLTHEVALYFRVHANTVRRWVKEDILPAQKLSHGWRFLRTDVERVWQSQQKVPT